MCSYHRRNACGGHHKIGMIKQREESKIKINNLLNISRRTFRIWFFRKLSSSSAVALKSCLAIASMFPFFVFVIKFRVRFRHVASVYVSVSLKKIDPDYIICWLTLLRRKSALQNPNITKIHVKAASFYSERNDVLCYWAKEFSIELAASRSLHDDSQLTNIKIKRFSSRYLSIDIYIYMLWSFPSHRLLPLAAPRRTLYLSFLVSFLLSLLFD